MEHARYVIVGAGQSGLQAAATLRQMDPSGGIQLVGSEPNLPYQRPPLSTTFLTGETTEKALYLRDEDFFRSADIEVLLGDPVAHIDRQLGRVVTEKGLCCEYDRLLIATGAAPRRLPLPGALASGVFYLRTLGDASRLRAHLRGGNRVVILGGGYIGMEVAAAIREACDSITIVEQADRTLGRVASPVVSAYLEGLHARAGVLLRLSTSIREISQRQGTLSGVVLTNDDVIPCDTFILAGGASPETTLARECGLAIDNGVLVDALARTHDERIWAAGDCACFPSLRFARRLRLESEPHAIDHATVAATNMAGGSLSYDPVPWFWSEQYDARLQIVGFPGESGRQVIRGSPGSDRFSVWHVLNGRVMAAECMNDSRAFNVAKKLLERGTEIDLDTLADSDSDLKRLLA